VPASTLNRAAALRSTLFCSLPPPPSSRLLVAAVPALPDADDGEDTQAPAEASSHGKYVALAASQTLPFAIAKQSNLPADPDARPARPRTRQTNPRVCILRISDPSIPSTVLMRANWSVGGDRA
jgi:hypothetical protein